MKYWFGASKNEMELPAPPSLLLGSEWIQGGNLQLQVPSSRHHPYIFCLILRHSSELHWCDPLSILQLLSVFVIKQHLPAHWTYSGLHLDIVLWNHSKLFSLLYLQFYSLHLILTTQTPNGVGTQRVKHFYCFYNQNGSFDSYCKFKWLHSSLQRAATQRKISTYQTSKLFFFQHLIQLKSSWWSLRNQCARHSDKKENSWR